MSNGEPVRRLTTALAGAAVALGLVASLGFVRRQPGDLEGERIRLQLPGGGTVLLEPTTDGGLRIQTARRVPTGNRSALDRLFSLDSQALARVRASSAELLLTVDRGPTLLLRDGRGREIARLGAPLYRPATP